MVADYHYPTGFEPLCLTKFRNDLAGRRATLRKSDLRWHPWQIKTPSQFRATVYSAMHEDHSVTRDDILGRLPIGTRERMDAIQTALERLVPTIDTFLVDRVFEPNRRALHAAIGSDTDIIDLAAQSSSMPTTSNVACPSIGVGTPLKSMTNPVLSST